MSKSTLLKITKKIRRINKNKTRDINKMRKLRNDPLYDNRNK